MEIILTRNLLKIELNARNVLNRSKQALQLAETLNPLAIVLGGRKAIALARNCQQWLIGNTLRGVGQHRRFITLKSPSVPRLPLLSIKKMWAFLNRREGTQDV